jgi:hypothetical protein
VEPTGSFSPKHNKENIPFPEKISDKICTDDGFLVEQNPDGREYPVGLKNQLLLK